VITALVAILVAVGYGMLEGAGGGSRPTTAADRTGGAKAGPVDSAGTGEPAPSFDPLEPTTGATGTPQGGPTTTGAAPTTTNDATTAPTIATTSGGAKTSGPPAATTPAPAVPAAVTFSGQSGYGCANTASQNWYTHNQDGAWRDTSGGLAGCSGAALGMPTSGDPNGKTDEYVVWWFETRPVLTGTCAVEVYIPSTSLAGGRPAHYHILGGRTSSTVSGAFSVDQTANRGRWVSGGTFPITGGGISVHLSNEGAGGTYLGASQARVSCKA